jgi:hypothetical protein
MGLAVRIKQRKKLYRHPHIHRKKLPSSPLLSPPTSLHKNPKPAKLFLQELLQTEV